MKGIYSGTGCGWEWNVLIVMAAECTGSQSCQDGCLSFYKGNCPQKEHWRPMLIALQEYGSE